jgi:prolyl 4-hydroxylase
MNQNVAKARSLLERGHAKEAASLLAQAAADGEPQAAAFLGDLRLSGHFIRRDLADARKWFGRAADLGQADVEPVFTALLANGAGGHERLWKDALTRLEANVQSDVWAARQSNLLAEMAIDEDGDPMTLPTRCALCLEPRVETIPGLLSAAECRYLIERSESLMQPAMVVDPRTGQLVRDPIRSASSAGFPFVLEDPALHAINRRIAAATGTTYEQGEPLQVLRYAPGEEYKLHSDALPPGGEQRVTTLLVALNTEFEGGETSFPRLGLNWRGKLGDALIFSNVDGAGRPEQRAWHAGLPITNGTKHLLSKWIRSAPLDLSGPPGRPL